MKITLTQNAYASGSYLRLPTEDGKESVFAMQGSWYEAQAIDDNSNEYTVYWDILDSWSGEDEGDACDWDHPTAIVQEDPWCDVTSKVTEIVF